MPKNAKKKKVVGKATAAPAVSKKVSKTKAPKKAGSRGKRYTSAERANVLSYVDEVNTKKGRGGAAAASRKFKISQITIGQWVRKAGKSAAAQQTSKTSSESASVGRPRAGRKGFAAKLRRLADVHEQISKVEAQLAGLQKEYASLKKGL